MAKTKVYTVRLEPGAWVFLVLFGLLCCGCNDSSPAVLPPEAIEEEVAEIDPLTDLEFACLQNSLRLEHAAETLMECAQSGEMERLPDAIAEARLAVEKLEAARRVDEP